MKISSRIKALQVRIYPYVHSEGNDFQGEIWPKPKKNAKTAPLQRKQAQNSGQQRPARAARTCFALRRPKWPSRGARQFGHRLKAAPRFGSLTLTSTRLVLGGPHCGLRVLASGAFAPLRQHARPSRIPSQATSGWPERWATFRPLKCAPPPSKRGASSGNEFCGGEWPFVCGKGLDIMSNMTYIGPNESHG
jgi:hypothetical protein